MNQKSDKKLISEMRLVSKILYYAKGELVEPIKPIVYYIDPATPENRKYIKQGIEEWQKPFETAGGFKTLLLRKTHQRKKKIPILVQRIYGIR
jgi:hypothetical protein